MKILITGATGFIGRELVNKLLKFSNHSILLLVNKKKLNLKNKNVKLIKGDININEKIFKKIKNFQPKILIHLAWEGIPDYSTKMSKINFIKQKKFFDKLFNLNSIKKIISTGSCSEINNKSNLTSRFFVNTKKKLKLKILNHCNKKNISFVWLRLFFVYGPNQRKNSLISFIIDKIKNNQKVILKQPNSKTDFVNTSDVADLIIKKINLKKESNTVDVGSGFCVKNKDLINYVKKITINPRKIEKKYFEKYKKNCFYAKINPYYNWKPKISLERGISLLVNDQ